MRRVPRPESSAARKTCHTLVSQATRHHVGPFWAGAIDAASNEHDSGTMATADVRSDLREIADHLPASASYADWLYELYVRMKISQGKAAADAGHVVPHEQVKRRFTG